jgi:hypothetical protein
VHTHDLARGGFHRDCNLSTNCQSAETWQKLEQLIKRNATDSLNCKRENARTRGSMPQSQRESTWGLGAPASMTSSRRRMDAWTCWACLDAVHVCMRGKSTLCKAKRRGCERKVSSTHSKVATTSGWNVSSMQGHNNKCGRKVTSRQGQNNKAHGVDGMSLRKAITTWHGDGRKVDSMQGQNNQGGGNVNSTQGPEQQGRVDGMSTLCKARTTRLTERQLYARPKQLSLRVD